MRDAKNSIFLEKAILDGLQRDELLIKKHAKLNEENLEKCNLIENKDLIYSAVEITCRKIEQLLISYIIESLAGEENNCKETKDFTLDILEHFFKIFRTY